MSVDIAAAALEKAVAVSAAIRTLIPRQSQPFQLAGQCVSLGEGTALRVQVFDAQNYFAAAAFGIEPGQQAAENVAQMQKAAGRRRKASYDRRIVRCHYLSPP